eukprot:scaffold31278_cov74-Phaeocystis_antarctica.AAC.7
MLGVGPARRPGFREHLADGGRRRADPTEARVRVDALARHKVLEYVVEVGGLHVHAYREDHAEDAQRGGVHRLHQPRVPVVEARAHAKAKRQRLDFNLVSAFGRGFRRDARVARHRACHGAGAKTRVNPVAAARALLVMGGTADELAAKHVRCPTEKRGLALATPLVPTYLPLLLRLSPTCSGTGRAPLEGHAVLGHVCTKPLLSLCKKRAIVLVNEVAEPRTRCELVREARATKHGVKEADRERPVVRQTHKGEFGLEPAQGKLGIRCVALTAACALQAIQAVALTRHHHNGRARDTLRVHSLVNPVAASRVDEVIVH